MIHGKRQVLYFLQNAHDVLCKTETHDENIGICTYFTNDKIIVGKLFGHQTLDYTTREKIEESLKNQKGTHIFSTTDSVYNHYIEGEKRENPGQLVQPAGAIYLENVDIYDYSFRKEIKVSSFVLFADHVLGVVPGDLAKRKEEQHL